MAFVQICQCDDFYGSAYWDYPGNYGEGQYGVDSATLDKFDDVQAETQPVVTGSAYDSGHNSYYNPVNAYQASSTDQRPPSQQGALVNGNVRPQMGPPRPQPMPQGPLRPPGPSNSFSGPPSAPMQRPSIPPSAPNGPSGPPGPPSSAPISGPGFYQFFELGIYFGNIIMQIGGYALCIIFGLMCLLIIWKVARICLGKIQF